MGGTTTGVQAAQQMQDATQGATQNDSTPLNGGGGAPQLSAPAAPNVQPTQPAQPGVAQPPAAAPAKPMSKLRSGLADIFGDLADSMAGKTRDVVYRDAQTGERITDKVPLTRGQQVMKILGEGLRGAAAGASVQPGPGVKGRAAAAGFQAQTQAQDQQREQQEALSNEDFEAKRKTMMDNANLALLGARTTASAFDLTQAKVKALEGSADYGNGITEQIQDMGGKDLGVVRNMNDLVALRQANPDLLKDHMNGRIYHAVNFDQNGNFDGMRYYTIPPDAGKQKIDHDITVRSLIPAKKVGEMPTVGSFTIPKGTMTVSEAATVSQAQDDKITKYSMDSYKAQSEAAERKAAIQKDRAEAYESGERGRQIAGDIAAQPQELDIKQELADAKAAAAQGKAVKVPAIVTNRAQLARNLQHNVDSATSLIQQNPNLVGDIAGRFTNIDQMKGDDNPAIQQIADRIENIAQASVGFHGSRSAKLVEEKANIILNSFHNGPKAIIGALQAEKDSSQTFIDDETNFQRAATPQPQTPAGASQEVYAADGKTLIGHVVNGAYVALGK